MKYIENDSGRFCGRDCRCMRIGNPLGSDYTVKEKFISENPDFQIIKKVGNTLFMQNKNLYAVCKFNTFVRVFNKKEDALACFAFHTDTKYLYNGL